MHSRIFTISEEPIKTNEFDNLEDELFDRMPSGTDYVDKIDEADWENAYNWLNGTPGIEMHLKSENGKPLKKPWFKITDKKAYFTDKYNEFKKYINIAANITLDDFCNPKSNADYNMYLLQKTFDDNYGFYIADNGNRFGLTSLDSFMRYANEGDKFYLGNVYDYHF